jgi:hypothetical protein
MHLVLINIFYIQTHFSYIIYTTQAPNSPCLCIIYIQTRVPWKSLKSHYIPFRFITCSPPPLYPSVTFQSRISIVKTLLLYFERRVPRRLRILGMKIPYFLLGSYLINVFIILTGPVFLVCEPSLFYKVRNLTLFLDAAHNFFDLIFVVSLNGISGI